MNAELGVRPVRQAAIAILLLVNFCLISTAYCGPKASHIALVVGIDRYENLRPLRNAVNDARAVAAALTSSAYDVTYLPDATTSEFDAAIETFATRLATAQLGIFYFAGHGFEVDGGNYLIARDTGLRQDGMPRRSQSIELLDLYRQITGPNTPVIILVDACRNNPQGVAGRARGRGAVSLYRALPLQGFKQETQNDLRADLLDREGTPRLVVAFSTGPGATADDGAGDHSPFAAAALWGLQIPGTTLLGFLDTIRNGTLAGTNQRQKPYYWMAGVENMLITPNR